MYRWISERASNALFSARSSSGSERVVSDKESRNSTSSKMVFSESLKSPASANYQVQNQYTVNIKLITFQFILRQKKTSKLYFLLLLKPLIITNQSCKHHLAFKMIKLYIIMSKKLQFKIQSLLQCKIQSLLEKKLVLLWSMIQEFYEHHYELQKLEKTQLRPLQLPTSLAVDGGRRAVAALDARQTLAVVSLQQVRAASLVSNLFGFILIMCSLLGLLGKY